MVGVYTVGLVYILCWYAAKQWLVVCVVLFLNELMA